MRQRLQNVAVRLGLLWVAIVLEAAIANAEVPDISSVAADLTVPPLSEEGVPGAGRRVKETLPAYADTEVYHALYLPTDWKPEGRYPVLVEFAGNGPYKNNYGDVSTGRVEGSRLGYGISGGRGFLWLCLPYLDTAGRRNVTKWWGSKPEYDPRPTIDYCKKAVKWVCEEYGGDPDRLILCGFSRGAIACNFIGLHDDEIAKLWRAFVPYSQYDGIKTGWPYPGADRASALKRLKRLRGRPQFICEEGEGVTRTEKYLRGSGVRGDFVFRRTGFRNHSDAWVLRPSPARKELRAWLTRVVER